MLWRPTMGVVAGIPDLIVLVDGRAHGPEIKTDKGRLSAEQKTAAPAASSRWRVLSPLAVHRLKQRIQDHSQQPTRNTGLGAKTVQGDRA